MMQLSSSRASKSETHEICRYKTEYRERTTRKERDGVACEKWVIIVVTQTGMAKLQSMISSVSPYLETLFNDCGWQSRYGLQKLALTSTSL